MPPLKGWIWGTMFVTCMESRFPTFASLPQAGSSRRVMWPRLNLGSAPVTFFHDLGRVRDPGIELPARGPVRFDWSPSILQALKRHIRRPLLITTEKW